MRQASCTMLPNDIFPWSFLHQRDAFSHASNFLDVSSLFTFLFLEVRCMGPQPSPETDTALSDCIIGINLWVLYLCQDIFNDPAWFVNFPYIWGRLGYMVDQWESPVLSGFLLLNMYVKLIGQVVLCASVSVHGCMSRYCLVMDWQSIWGLPCLTPIDH